MRSRGCKVKDVACLVDLAKYMTPISLLLLPYYSNCTAPFDGLRDPPSG